MSWTNPSDLPTQPPELAPAYEREEDGDEEHDHGDPAVLDAIEKERFETVTPAEIKARRQRIASGADWLDHVSTKDWLYIVGLFCAILASLGAFLWLK